MPALPAGLSTALVIIGVGIPPYSARGLTQTLSAATIGAQTRRTVNGKLINLAPPQFEKYHSLISGNDQEPPGIDGVFPGASITIECIAELSLPVGASPDRPVVVGSVRIDGAFLFYRPILEMLVTNFSMQTDEWGAQVNWSLDSEEV